jgi:hypothetical protein
MATLRPLVNLKIVSLGNAINHDKISFGGVRFFGQYWLHIGYTGIGYISAVSVFATYHSISYIVFSYSG